MVAAFERDGWIRFPSDPKVLAWVERVKPEAEAAVVDPELAEWLQCEGTWFVGVDALANDASGAVNGSGPLAGAAVDFIRAHLGEWPDLHRAQLSVMYPGYPRPREGEGEGAFRYRLKRDAAHVDGLLPEGPERRRLLREPHAWILGLPLNRAAPEASPLVVWEGSHHVMGAAFRAAFATGGSGVDLTDTYQAARREVFETGTRREIAMQPGEAVLLHRHLLHGVAPWNAPDKGEGRMIAYFRPEMANIEGWFA